MKAAEKLAALEQLARDRTVKGWAFRGLPAAEIAEIRAFLNGGECPPQHRSGYALARQQLRLPTAWVVCPCSGSGPYDPQVAAAVVARCADAGTCRLPHLVVTRPAYPHPGEALAALTAAGLAYEGDTCPVCHRPAACWRPGHAPGCQWTPACPMIRATPTD